MNIIERIRINRDTSYAWNYVAAMDEAFLEEEADNLTHLEKDELRSCVNHSKAMASDLKKKGK